MSTPSSARICSPPVVVVMDGSASARAAGHVFPNHCHELPQLLLPVTTMLGSCTIYLTSGTLLMSPASCYESSGNYSSMRMDSHASITIKYGNGVASRPWRRRQHGQCGGWRRTTVVAAAASSPRSLCSFQHRVIF